MMARPQINWKMGENVLMWKMGMGNSNQNNAKSVPMPKLVVQRESDEQKTVYGNGRQRECGEAEGCALKAV
jgi:hypothetical protein